MEISQPGAEGWNYEGLERGAWDHGVVELNKAILEKYLVPTAATGTGSDCSRLLPLTLVCILS